MILDQYIGKQYAISLINLKHCASYIIFNIIEDFPYELLEEELRATQEVVLSIGVIKNDMKIENLIFKRNITCFKWRYDQSKTKIVPQTFDKVCDELVYKNCVFLNEI